MEGREDQLAFGEQGDLAGGHGGNGEQEESRKRGESAHAHSVCGFSPGGGVKMRRSGRSSGPQAALSWPAALAR